MIFSAPQSTRRSMLIGSAALAATMPGTAAAAPSADQLRTAVRRLRFRTDEGPVFWWIKGTSFAVIDAVLTPLYDVCFGSIQQVTNRGDGGFDVLQLELGFRMDITGQRRMTTFRNPFTGEESEVIFAPVGPSRISYSVDVIPSVPATFGGSKLQFTPHPGAPYVEGGTFFAPYRASSRIVTPGQPDRVWNDIALFHGPARTALDPSVKMAPASAIYSDIASFARWTNMGDRAGNTLLRATGGKVANIRHMPAAWKDLVREYDASLLSDPMGALQRPREANRG